MDVFLVTVVSLVIFVLVWMVFVFLIRKKQGSLTMSLGGGFLLAIMAFAMMLFVADLWKQYQDRSLLTATGFPDMETLSTAKQHGYETYADYKVYLNELKAKREKLEVEKKAQLAEKKRQEDLKCQESAECTATHNYALSALKCQRAIESAAKYDFKWTDGFLSRKFYRFSWIDKQNKVIAFMGDRIKFQNGFGNFIVHKYSCYYDVDDDRLINLMIEPGRF